MNNFGALYVGELKKCWQGGKKYVLIALFLVVFLLMCVAFEVLSDAGDLFPESGSMDPVEAKAQIETQMNEYLKAVEEGSAASGPMDQTLHRFRAQIAACDYCIEKGIALDLNQRWYGLDFGMNGNFGSALQSADAFMEFATSALFSVILIMVIVLTAAGITNEFRNGTVKLMLMRPMSRNRFLAAKSLSVMTFGAGALVISFLISFIYGACRFGLNIQNCFAYFEGTVFEMGASKFILNFTIYLFMLYCFTQLIGFLAVLSPKTHLAMIVGLIFALAGALWQLLLGYTYLGYASFTINMDLSQFFTLSGPVMKDMSFYAALALCALYLGGLTAAKYIVFNRRDI